MAKILLLDGMNLAFRAFYGMPDLRRADGLPTGALHGWVRTLWMLENLEQPDHMLVFFDLGPPVRHEAILQEYKANRTACPPDLETQFPWIRRLSCALGYGAFESYGVEADDLIASAVRILHGAGHTITIVSADKDLGQLVQEGVWQLHPPPTAHPKLGWKRLDVSGVYDKFGVPPALLPDLLALTGDSSDNIPGLEGVGVKTAAKWLQTYHSLQGVIDHCGELKPVRCQALVHAQQTLLLRNRQLTTLDATHPLTLSLPLPRDLSAAEKMLEELGLKSSLVELRKRLQNTPTSNT